MTDIIKLRKKLNSPENQLGLNAPGQPLNNLEDKSLFDEDPSEETAQGIISGQAIKPVKSAEEQRANNLRQQLNPVIKPTSSIPTAGPAIAPVSSSTQAPISTLEQASVNNIDSVEKINQEKQSLKQLLSDAKSNYDKNINKTEWAEIASDATKALVQLAAGAYGLNTNKDMSGVKFDKTDWSNKYGRLRDRLNMDLKDITDQGEELDKRAGGIKTPAQLELENLNKDKLKAEIGKTKAETAALGQKSIAEKESPGQKQLDTEFAKDKSDYLSQGGSANIDKDLQQLEEAKKLLEGGSDTISGPILGYLSKKYPDVARSLNAEGTKVQDYIQEVVQKNARLILGSAYTKEEGERLMAKAYDPQADEQENKDRLTRLVEQIKKARDIKEKAIQWSQEHNGSLKGFDLLNQLPKSADDIKLTDKEQVKDESNDLSSEDKQAFEWARANNNDPRAAQIIKKLNLAR